MYLDWMNRCPDSFVLCKCRKPPQDVVRIYKPCKDLLPQILHANFVADKVHRIDREIVKEVAPSVSDVESWGFDIGP